jgi:hypothetical protein
MLENHSSSCARPSSGSSTKSASGFSSKMSENCLLSLDQFVMVGVMFRNILKPTCTTRQPCLSSVMQRGYLGYHLCHLSEVGAGWCARLGKEVFDQTQADVVAHAVQLLVDLGVVELVVFAQLGDDGAIGERDELGADLVDPRPWKVRLHPTRRGGDLLPDSGND